MKALVVSMLTGIVLLVAAYKEPQNNFEPLPKNSENFLQNLPKTEKLPDNNNREWGATIEILEARNLAFITKEQSKHRIRKNIELYRESESGDMYTYPEKSMKATEVPEGSGDGYATTKRSAETTGILEGSGDGYATTIMSAETTGVPEGSGDGYATTDRSTDTTGVPEGSGDDYATTDMPAETTVVPEGSEDDHATTERSVETTGVPEGPGDGYTTAEMSAETTGFPNGSGDVYTTMKQYTDPEQCQHGGTFNGDICVCHDYFFGDLCEFIKNKIVLGPNVTITVNVGLTITNVNFTTNLTDKTSPQYKAFETRFKAEMNLVYRMSEYQDVEILNVSRRQDNRLVRASDVIHGIIVVHDVIMEMEYTLDNNNTYETLLKTVEIQLTSLEDNCTSGTSKDSLCIDRRATRITSANPTAKEHCNSKIPEYYQNFFTSNLTENGVICLSDCYPRSVNYKDCQGGHCYLFRETGVSCHCPRKDLYFYTSWNCKEKLLKNGVYGGVGASIAVLIIVIVGIFGIHHLQRRRDKKWETLDTSQENLFEDTDNVWEKKVFSMGLSGVTDGSIDKSTTKHFKPSLEKVDTTLKIEIQRPTICPANQFVEDS